MEDLYEVNEFILRAYESAEIYKIYMKYVHDQKILKREFVLSDWVLPYNSRLRLFPKKLKSKWSRPFKVSNVY